MTRLKSCFNLIDTIHKQLIGMCATKDIDTYSTMYCLARKNMDVLADLIYDKHFNSMEEEDQEEEDE